MCANSQVSQSLTNTLDPLVSVHRLLWSWNYISWCWFIRFTSAVGTSRSGAKYHRHNRELRYWEMIWLIWVCGICWQYHENHIKCRINNFLSWASQSLREDNVPLYHWTQYGFIASMLISCFWKKTWGIMGWDWQVRLIKLQIPAIKQRHIGEFNLTPVNMPSPILLHDIHTLLFIAQLWMPHRKQHQRKHALSTDFHHCIVSIGSNWSQKLVSAFEVGLLMLAFLKVMSTAKVNELFTAVDGTSLLLFTNGWRLWCGMKLGLDSQWTLH